MKSAWSPVQMSAGEICVLFEKVVPGVPGEIWMVFELIRQSVAMEAEPDDHDEDWEAEPDDHVLKEAEPAELDHDPIEHEPVEDLVQEEEARLHSDGSWQLLPEHKEEEVEEEEEDRDKDEHKLCRAVDQQTVMAMAPPGLEEAKERKAEDMAAKREPKDMCISQMEC